MGIENGKDVEVIREKERITIKAIIEEEKGFFNSEVKPGDIVRTKNDDRKIYTIKDVKSQNQDYEVKWGWKPDIYENPILNKFLDDDISKVFAEEYIRFKYTMHHGPEEENLTVDHPKWYQVAYSNLATFYNIGYAKRMLDSINRESSFDRNNLHYLNSFFFFVMAAFDTLAEQINIICCDKDLGAKIYLHSFLSENIKKEVIKIFEEKDISWQKFFERTEGEILIFRSNYETLIKQSELSKNMKDNLLKIWRHFLKDKKTNAKNYKRSINYLKFINERKYRYSELQLFRNKIAHSTALVIKDKGYLPKLVSIYGERNNRFDEELFVKICKNRPVYKRDPRPEDYEDKPIHEQCSEYFKGACSLCGGILKLLRKDYLKSQIYEEYSCQGNK